MTASTRGIRDADGLAGVTYEYQWFQVDGTVATEISGETGRTYTLAPDDAGKRVKVEVSFTDQAMNGEGPLESPAFPMTGTIAPPPPSMDPSDLLSATLTVKSIPGSSLGCIDGTGTNGCGNTAVLTDDDFRVGTGTHTIRVIELSGSTVSVILSSGLSNADERTHYFQVTEGSTTNRLKFSSGTTSGVTTYRWSNTSQSWSVDDTVTVKVINDPGRHHAAGG